MYDNIKLGQMRCPKCGCMRPTIPGPCHCGYDSSKEPTPKYRIYKYKLTGATKQVLTLPKQSVILRTAIVQSGVICLYARINPLITDTADVEVGVVGTGWEIPDEPLYNPGNYFQTVSDGDYVWHIFVRPVPGTMKIVK